MLVNNEIPNAHPDANPVVGHHNYDAGIALVDEVQPGLNLRLQLKSPMQMMALLQSIDAVKEQTQAALKNLHYVHFARFLPESDGSALWVITVFDGEFDAENNPNAYDDSMKSYLMDFVVVLGDVFDVMLEFVQDAPRLPVTQYPRDFIDFVEKNNTKRVNPWSAYPRLTVIDIITSRSFR